MWKSMLQRLKPESAPSKGAAGAAELLVQGRRFEEGGDIEAARGCYERATQIAPALAEAHLNLGILLAAAGRPEAALQAYARLLALEPGHAYGNYNLASLEVAAGQLPAAAAHLRSALQAKPDFPEALLLLAHVLEEQGQPLEALRHLDEAIRLRTDYAGAHHNRVLLLRRLGRAGEAIDAARQLAGMVPDDAEAHAMLGSLLWEDGFVVEAAPHYRRAAALQPERLDWHSRALFALNFDEHVAAQEIAQRHADFGRMLDQEAPAQVAHGLHAAPTRRLRVGLVSGDLRVHPVALFLIPWLERRSRDAFEVVCFSCDARTDHVTSQLRSLADGWIDAAAMSASELAIAVRGQSIDILVDLTGHTARPALLTFAARPAPVQASWLGYLNTTGLKSIDWRLCDSLTDPPGTAGLNTEKLAYLPSGQWCYRPFLPVESSGRAPVERNGAITFGSFNYQGKVTGPMCDRWASLLARVPGSRILVAGMAAEAKRAQVRDALRAQGVDPARADFEPRADLEAYFALYDKVDIALDTFPYGGGTTTFDALWMGVPVVTARGETPASRSAASILSRLGLDDWIAPSVDGYVEVAARQAADPAGIAALKRSLRARLASSVLMDEERFVRDFEAALQAMWEGRGAGL